MMDYFNYFVIVHDNTVDYGKERAYVLVGPWDQFQHIRIVECVRLKILRRIERRENEKIGRRAMLNGSLAFQRALWSSGPRLRSRCFLCQSHCSWRTKI